MGKIEVERCFSGGVEIAGLKVIVPARYGDSRGWFSETYNQRDLAAVGISDVFVQDNQSMSVKGVLRGLHFQKKYPQAKLVRVISGAVFDVAVDIRRGSDTFGGWCGVELSAENRRQLFIPKGFAHGFYVLSDTAEFCYKCTEFYHPDDEGGIIWDDATIGVEWPLLPDSAPVISDKDKLWPRFKDVDFQK